MTHRERVKLWDAINTYTKSCGGDPSQDIKTDRCLAVSGVEEVVRQILERARRQEIEETIASVLP